ncbi:MAG: DNA modification methylase [Candidatus Omnitrophica bacterium]|nr:DNA modification methylase [Candidatus Omnitrophota bacterium]
MDIRKVGIEVVKQAPYNPQVMKDSQRAKLRQSIEVYSYVDPIVWNSRTGHAVGGNHRLQVLKDLGYTEIEVVVVDLSLEQEKALNVALNQIHGQFDQEKLGALIDELTRLPNFDVGLTGFEAPELSKILDNYFESKADDFDFDGAVGSMKEAITKRGDIIQLNHHRLLCGDSSNRDDLKRLMDGETASLIHSDPPYAANYCPDNRPDKNGGHKKVDLSKVIQNDNLPQKEYEKWLKVVLGNVTQFLEGNASLYLWNGFRQFGPMTQMLTDLGFHISNVITWVKPSICISYSDYNFQSEYCIYAWRQGQGSHRWYGSTKESNVWQVNRDSINSLIHQNQKPIELAQRAIKNSSMRGEIVLDTFLGSGSTLIAAESLSRRCYGVEISPVFCDGIIRRYISYAGKEKVSKELLDKYYDKEASNGR